MVDREALTGGAQVHLEPVLGDVDADEDRGLVHDPVSLDTGLLALVTVRVAGRGRRGARFLTGLDGPRGKRAPADRDPILVPRSGQAEHTNGKVRYSLSQRQGRGPCYGVAAVDVVSAAGAVSARGLCAQHSPA